MAETVHSKSDGAAEYFRNGFSCSQAVLAAFGPGEGLDADLSLKVACAFGGGMASTGGVCGAVTGGLLVIGLKHGRCRAEDLPAKDRTYALGRQFMGEYRDRHGSLICRELLGFDLGTPEGKARFAAEGCHGRRCAPLVRDAAEILERIL